MLEMFLKSSFCNFENKVYEITAKPSPFKNAIVFDTVFMNTFSAIVKYEIVCTKSDL